jgi:hypothetical protein
VRVTVYMLIDVNSYLAFHVAIPWGRGVPGQRL